MFEGSDVRGDGKEGPILSAGFSAASERLNVRTPERPNLLGTVWRPVYTLRRRQWLPLGRRETFAFFERPEHLADITPPWLDFRILTPGPLVMAPGAVIEYSIRVFGLRRRWRTLISEYDPPSGFRDVQLAGPYRLWDHRHRFWEEDGGTVVEDLVMYALPFGPLGRPIHWLVVQSRLAAIFHYRRRRIHDLLGRCGPARRSGIAS